MFPRSTTLNIANTTVGAANPPGYGFGCHILPEKSADFSYLRLCDFSPAILFARISSLTLPALSKHVPHIIRLRTKKEVGRIHTTLNVASMEYPQTIGYRAAVNLIRQAMGVLLPAVFPNNTVPVGPIRRTLPKPAVAGVSTFLDPSPKSEFGWNAFRLVPASARTIVGRLGKVSNEGAAAQGADVRGAWGTQFANRATLVYTHSIKSPVLRFGRTPDVSALRGFSVA